MDWHRLFGLILTDFFTGTGYEVELEKDLSLQHQFLDVVILRKSADPLPFRLPDGLDNLADHNLISFKSYQEAFDAWAMKELMGHYVNYRKQASPSTDNLIAEDRIRCYGVCARFPTQLADQMRLEVLQPGVLECRWGTDVVRILVLRDLPQEEHNAPLHLFSAAAGQIQYGREHFQQRSARTSTLIQTLMGRYTEEGIPMPYTMDDFMQEYKEKALKLLTPEERLQGLPPEELLKALSPEELVKNLSPEKLAAVRKLLNQKNGDSPKPE
jgi:hypothetical protein